MLHTFLWITTSIFVESDAECALAEKLYTSGIKSWLNNKANTAHLPPGTWNSLHLFVKWGGVPSVKYNKKLLQFGEHLAPAPHKAQLHSCESRFSEISKFKLNVYFVLSCFCLIRGHQQR